MRNLQTEEPVGEEVEALMMLEQRHSGILGRELAEISMVTWKAMLFGMGVAVRLKMKLAGLFGIS